MQPQSDKSLVDRFLEWWRGLWSQSGRDPGSAAPDRTTDHSSPADEAEQATRNDVPGESPTALSVATSPQGVGDAASTITSDDVGPNGSQAVGVAGSTGASYDEFSTGGYVPDAIDQEEVEAAAVTDAVQERLGGDENDSNSDGNLKTQAEGSTGLTDTPTAGDQHQDDAEAVVDAIRDESAASGVDITEDLGIGTVTSLGRTDTVSSGTPEGMVSDYLPDTDTVESEEEAADAVGVTSVGDLDAVELGTLEDAEIATTEVGSVSNDETRGTAAIDQDSADIYALDESGHDTSDYTSAANQDIGMRTVDEDAVGLSGADDSPTYSGSDDSLEEGIAGVLKGPDQLDTDDARPLSDFTQAQSGFASAADDLSGADDEPNVGTGLFGTSDIDTTDLSYLDDADNRRFDFTELSDDQASMPSASETSAASTSTVADDIGASPTGVTDVAANAVVADTGVESPEPARESGDENVAAAQGVAPGVTTTSRSDATGPGGSIRGDASGSCPDDYPIKGNSSSKIYHSPGLASYRGTKAEWCFATEGDAISAGFRAPGTRNVGAKTGAGPTTASRTQPPTVANRAGTDTVGFSQVAGEENVLPETGSPGEGSDGAPGASMESTSEFGSSADDIESLESQSPDDLAFIQSQGSRVANEPPTSTEVSAALDTEAEITTRIHADIESASDENGLIHAGAVRGDGTNVCPVGYPIKGNAGSMIFHTPGRASYEATIAEWCFATEQDAIGAGFRAPKR